MSTAVTPATPATIATAEFAAILAKGAASVLDVRTPAEFAECHVAGAKLAPLDALDPRKAADALKPADGSANTTIYLLCKSGGRATNAAVQFIAAGIANVCVVTGGTDACASVGVPVERGAKSVIPLDGQVRIVIGVMLLLFLLLARYVHYAFGYLIPAIAVALIVSGLTGFCGMAILLGKAPWNQNKDTGSCRVC
ncbi:MAG: rhodanese-like domain-containing protein [Chthoniobacteraceae bacterium]